MADPDNRPEKGEEEAGNPPEILKGLKELNLAGPTRPEPTAGEAGAGLGDLNNPDGVKDE